MRIQYLIEFIVISLFLVALILATVFKRRKFLEKTSTSLFHVLISIIIPLGGNILSFFTDIESIADLGYMLMLLGDSFLILNFTVFIMDYCGLRFRHSSVQYLVVIILAAISVSTLLNPLFHHIYSLKRVSLSDGYTYFAIVSNWGRLLIFSLNEAIMILLIAIIIDKCLKVSSAYHERYIVVIFSIVISMGFLFTSFSDRPVNESLIGYVICGFFLYIITFIYKPLFIRRKLADSVVENHTDGIIFYDTDVNALYANDKAYEILRIKSGIPEKCTDKLIYVMGGADLGVDFDISTKFKDDNGEPVYLSITHRLMKDKRSLDVGSFFSIHDDTEQVKLNEERKYIATHDVLTGLPNRISFEDQVKAIIKANPNESYCMQVSDINDFKLINDIYGREKADEILLKIAHDLEEYAPPGSAICRWRGDIFCVFLKKSYIDIPALEKQIKDTWGKSEITNSPIIIHVGLFEPSESDKGMSVSGLVDRAQLAIAGIKDDFNKCVAVYDDNLRKDKLWEQQITNELENALTAGQVIPYLQPQYRAEGNLEGGEVLVRWNHPKEGLIPPFKFIPVFEKNGMIATIDRYIWGEACKILKDWSHRTDGHEKLNLSINISPKDFYFMDIYEVITGLVKEHGIDPGHLHLEITESAVMNNATEHIKTINKLRDFGFTFEMDDFGSGYSSLNMLKDMPVDVLKIDMVFLSKTDDFKKSKTILNSIVDMANHLDMLQITEGVETKEQFDMLKEMGCKLFQGYFFSKPVPVDEFEKLPLIWE